MLPELVERTIDHLEGDKSSLLASSLVCKAWLTRSQYNLYSSVIIDVNKNRQVDYEDFSRLADYCEAFAAFVSTYTRPAGYVRRLVIDNEEDASIIPAFLPLYVLDKMMSALPNLQKLELYAMELSHTWIKPLGKSGLELWRDEPVYPQVKELVLGAHSTLRAVLKSDEYPVDRAAKFWDVVYPFRNMRELTMVLPAGQFYEDAIERSPADEAPLPTSLLSLNVLTYEDDAKFAKLLYEKGRPTGLQSLQVSACSAIEFTALVELLSTVSTLHHLGVTLIAHCLPKHNKFVKFFPIPTNLDLQSLSFGLTIDLAFDTSIHVLNWNYALRSLRMMRWTYLHLSLVVNEDSTLQQIKDVFTIVKWRSLDDEAEKLKSVTFVLQLMYQFETEPTDVAECEAKQRLITELAEAKLPKLKEYGKLKVVRGGKCCVFLQCI